MPPVLEDIYASAAMRRLLADEADALPSGLQACSGDHALLLSAAVDDAPAALPLLSHWTCLRVQADGYDGEVRARGDEPLPFTDHAFELVVLRHALECSSQPEALLREACRVLASGGLIVVTGVHPLSPWAPWLAWKSRGQLARPHWPLQAGEWLRRSNVQVERTQRTGPFWPGAKVAPDRRAGGSTTAPLGGAFVLLGRKQRSTAVIHRMRPQTERAPGGAPLASGAQRLSA